MIPVARPQEFVSCIRCLIQTSWGAAQCLIQCEATRTAWQSRHTSNTLFLWRSERKLLDLSGNWLDDQVDYLQVLWLCSVLEDSVKECATVWKTRVTGVLCSKETFRYKFKTLYAQQFFQRYSIKMNSLSSGIWPIMDTRSLRGGRPPFLKLYGNFPLVLQANNTKYFYLWMTGEPNLYSRDQCSTLLSQAAGDKNVESMVPIRYTRIKPPPTL